MTINCDIPNKIIINTDGGSRGNPGPAAIGVVIADDKGRAIREYREAIGKATNNEAEYQAIIFALKKAKLLFGKKNTKKAKVEINIDSELAVNQLNGKFKIINAEIQKLFIQIWNLKIDFMDVKFNHIKREKNKEADKLVNEALDMDGKSQNGLGF